MPKARTLLLSLAFILLAGSVMATAQNPLQFVAVTPCRIVDTRITGMPIQAGTAQSFPVQGSQGNCNNIPPSAAGYSMNVTVVPYESLGYLTVWPTGLPQPDVSTLNSIDGRVKANAAIVGAGSSGGGAVSVYAAGKTDVILDLNGYFAPSNTSSLAFYPATPCRVLDTRNGGGPLPGGQEFDFPVSGLCNIPSGAAAYSLNVTAIPYEPLYYLTVWPKGQNLPEVSTLNSLTGTIVANAAMVVAGDGGEIAAYPTNPIDLVVDINGYYAPPGAAPDGLSLFFLTPCRVLDTRPNGQFSGTRPVNGLANSCGLPSLAQAMVTNATVQPPGPLGWLTLWPNGQQEPLASTLNAYDGQITSNMAVVPTTNDYIDAYASDPTQLIVDLSSYFATPSGLSGNYSFTIDGYNTPNNGGSPPPPCQTGTNIAPFIMAGSFVATPDSPFDGNGTVSGVFDLNCANLGSIQPLDVTFSGSYSIQPGTGLGTMTITPTRNTPFHLSVAISSSGNGRLVLNNESTSYLPGAWGTGAINVQNPAAFSFAQIAGNFASGFSGVDPSLNRIGGAGAYQIGQDGKAIGSADTNDNGTLATRAISGLLMTPDPKNFGRGTATFISNGMQTNWAYYPTSANELTFVETDKLTSPGANLVLQTMLRQTESTFDNSSLNAVSVIRSSGLAQSTSQKQQAPGTVVPDVQVGTFTADGAGNASVSIDENKGGTLSQQSSSGTYSVAANGRVALSGFGNNAPPILYLVGKNEAFILGQDAEVAFGFGLPQVPKPFTNASALGTYWGGSFQPVTTDVTDSVTWMLSDGMGNLNGTVNSSGPAGVATQNFTATYSVDNTGRITLNENGSLAIVGYVATPTKMVLLPATDPNPTVTVVGSTN